METYSSTDSCKLIAAAPSRGRELEGQELQLGVKGDGRTRRSQDRSEARREDPACVVQSIPSMSFESRNNER